LPGCTVRRAACSNHVITINKEIANKNKKQKQEVTLQKLEKGANDL
jgi:NADH:ubiquinone oxidoreductase subunit B-like Fe-S oxidoreductase